MVSLDSPELALLSRPTGALISFSDTFSTPRDGRTPAPGNNNAAEEHPPHHDFDSELTSQFRHLRPRDGEYGIGDGPDNSLLAAYGVELIAQLTDGLKAEIDRGLHRAEAFKIPAHPNILEAQQFIQSRAIRVIANAAPRRDDDRVKNGSNFYLAILDNGVEVYATPLDALQFVRDRIKNLFEIPNEQNPLFDGEREQFRSSIIGRFCERPEHLREWYPLEKEGESPGDRFGIPKQDHPIQLAYFDRFGNIRLRARQGSLADWAITAARDEAGRIGVNFPVLRNSTHPARLRNCLDKIPGGTLGLYRNVADGETGGDKPAYLELAYKWRGDEKINTHREIGRPPIGSAATIVKIHEATIK